ncbi:MAG TPA: DUF4249 domain-containing protein [Bacteroidales bacterium]|nr:DUF4249 domain-containing protein [Bacteroidales bacterium]
MKNIKTYLLISAIVVLFYSCKEEFDYNQMTEGLERMVVEAYITDIDSIHTIKLMRSSDYIDPQPAIPASTAIVTVSDGTNTYNFSEVNPGVYQNMVPFHGIVGKTYNLSISYEEENYSAKSALGECFEMENIYSYYQDSINYLLLCGQEPTQPNQYYIFKTIINGVADDTLTNWDSFDDELINGHYFDYELFAMLRGNETDTIDVILSSVSKEFYDYFTSIAQNTGYEPDPFFSTTPANFKGNINNGGLGFFQAMSVRKKSCIRL